MLDRLARSCRTRATVKLLAAVCPISRGVAIASTGVLGCSGDETAVGASRATGAPVAAVTSARK